MTTVAALSPAPSDLPRGSNLAGVRAYNERLILSVVRRNPGVAKAEIARGTGLSAQTVSVIVRELESEGLLERLARVRGRVGQPSVPLRIAPDGAFALGLKVGRRSADLVLMDFAGGVRDERHWTYAYPDPDRMLGPLEQAVAELTGKLTPDARRRIVGLGVALPFELWNWVEQVGGPPEVLAAWKSFDVRAELEARLGLAVIVSNDATAACGAELTFGVGRKYRDFIYLFIGSFAGGGVVLNGALHVGSRGNAGALGSMPAPGPHGTRQLIQTASLVCLEARIAAAGGDPAVLFRGLDGWDAIGGLLDPWIAEAADGLAHAIVASAAVIDFEAAIIDGWLPPDVRARLVAATRRAVGAMDLQGISPIEVVEGAVGPNARALGGASLPLAARFLIERDDPLARRG